MRIFPICINCDDESTYIVDNIGTEAQYFCDQHLPKFFNKNKLPETVKPLVAPVPESTTVETPKSTKKKSASKTPAEAVAESTE